MSGQQQTLPPGLVPIATAVSAVKYVTLSAAYAGSLVIPLALLLLFCPRPVRRTPVFPILIITLLFGIIWAFLSFAENIESVKYPLNTPVRGLFLGSSSLNFLIPIFTDTVLIFKLLWLYPAFQYAWWQRGLLVALPTLMTVPRLVVISVFLDRAGRAYDSEGGILAAVTYLAASRLPLAEFCMQLVSNTYCSGVLLIKAYMLLYGQKGGQVHRSKALLRRLRVMLQILVSSFLIPVCIEIALVGTFAGSNDPNVREPIQWTNTYVSLHCAVLATVWSSIGDSLSGEERQGGGGSSWTFKNSGPSVSNPSSSATTSKQVASKHSGRTDSTMAMKQSSSYSKGIDSLEMLPAASSTPVSNRHSYHPYSPQSRVPAPRQDGVDNNDVESLQPSTYGGQDGSSSDFTNHTPSGTLPSPRDWTVEKV